MEGDSSLLGQLLEKKFSNCTATVSEAAVERDAVVSDIAVCQSVYLWITELLDHPCASKITSRLGDDTKCETDTTNDYYDSYLVLMKQFAEKFRCLLRENQSIPVALLNDLSFKSLDMKRKYSWSIPSPAAVNKIKEHLPIIEVGAGTGYWAHCLEKAGVNTSDLHCFDCSTTWLSHLNQYQDGSTCAVENSFYSALQQGPPEVVSSHSDKTLLLMWPDFMGLGDFGHQALLQYSGNTIITVGEWADATLGAYSSELQNTFSGQSFSTAFQLKMSREFDLQETVRLPSWPLYCDELRVYSRKPEPETAKWNISTHPKLGRYMTAATDITAGSEILNDEPLLNYSEEGNESKYIGMYRAATSEEGSLARFFAAGLQCTGEASAHEELFSIMKHSVGDESETLRHWKQLVQVGSCFHYNGFGGANSDGKLKLRVFPNISFCNHSCAPNCVVIPNEGSLRSIATIGKGESVTISYLDSHQLLLPTEKRRQLLQSRWGFVCGCDRCAQPSDDVRVFTVAKQIKEPTNLNEERDQISFNDSDGDVINIRANINSKSIIYSINGEDRPESRSMKYNRLTGILHLTDIDREIEIPSDLLPILNSIVGTAGVEDATGLDMMPACETVGCTSWFGCVESSADVVSVQCLQCSQKFSSNVTTELLEAEQQALSLPETDEVVAKFSALHIRHWLSHKITVAETTISVLQKQLIINQLQSLYWNPHADRAINNYVADQYASLAEAHTISNEHEEAADAYNKQINLRHINDIQTEGWPSESSCQPSASVLNFLFKD